MTQGWFNHYDNPDEEDLEEESVARSTRAEFDNHYRLEEENANKTSVWTLDSKISPDADTRIVNPFKKSALVNVQLTVDRLPTQINFGRQWKKLFEPSEYGKSIMDAYMHAVFEKATQAADLRKMLNRPPTLRLAAPLLLRTMTSAEYKEVYSAIFHPSARTFNGPGRNSSGAAGLTVSASSVKLLSVKIDREWGYLADPEYIALDIVDCCNRAREAAPKLETCPELDGESDQSVISRIVRHERRLMESAE
ncbi:hypothetical protein [Nocardia fluminea]|uniref:hypothetical protein n=1 Tax=Nocardia fluminea TaxID=134984 RepID=UPI0037BCC85A